MTVSHSCFPRGCLGYSQKSQSSSSVSTDLPITYELPEPEKKSKIVEASEAFGEHVLQPIGEHMPRAAKGSTSRVPMNEELRLLQEQIYAIPPHETKESDLDDSATVAIPQRGAADTQQSEQPEQRKQTKQSDQSASSNPRAGWR